MDKHVDCVMEELKRVVHRLEGMEKRISQMERHRFFAEYRPLPAWVHNMVDKMDKWLKQRTC